MITSCTFTYVHYFVQIVSGILVNCCSVSPINNLNVLAQELLVDYFIDHVAQRSAN